ncbi:hypothetical protein IT570_11645 [Candidatus Sumerlaeota bacterium]|nr:hypothetical protein [Candidatus Sumerlaeota bacterium]
MTESGNARAATIPLRRGIAMMPVAHSVLTYALQVRRAIDQVQPDCVALELPRALGQGISELVSALPRIDTLCYKSPKGPAQLIAADPCDALIEAYRQCGETGRMVELIDVADAGADVPYFNLPDDVAIESIGLRRYALECLKQLPQLPVTSRERTIAARLRLLADRYNRVLYIGGMMHVGNLRALLRDDSARSDAALWNEMPLPYHINPLRENQLTHVLREMPQIAWLHRITRRDPKPISRDRALQLIISKACLQYTRELDERINAAERRALFQFGRNLSLLHGMLQPRTMELVTAAKGCVDDDFGAICLEIISSYPGNSGEDLPDTHDDAARHQSLALHTDFGNGMERLRHSYPFPELQEVEYHFKRRRSSKEDLARWRADFAEDLWNGAGICSWPPEDLFIERFFRTIRTRAQQQVSEHHSTVEEFSGSILDGLDIRETMRRWNEKKIFVRRERIPPGKVGAVVLIWRDFPLSHPSQWRTSLYAENQNESDIAFYADPLGKEMVGPGISRTEYHGILSVFPAAHIPDAWAERSLRAWGDCSRVLAAAAVHLSAERLIAYVAAHPPDAELRQYARIHRKSFIYLPLSTFSKSLLKRARQCHILAGRNVRAYAGDYIPEI